MALVNCPKCGKNVSDIPKACYHCGCSLEGVHEQEEIEKAKKAAQAAQAPKPTPVKVSPYSYIQMPKKPKKDNITLGIAIFFGLIAILGFTSEGFFSTVMGICGLISTVGLLIIRENTYNEEWRRYRVAVNDFERYQREEHERIKRAALQRQLEEAAKPKVTCPYCGSTDVNKMSAVGKAIEVGILGVYALPSASKQWYCKNCKSEF